ncbi:MAG: hypothetical protein WBD40_10515 [Tepidisphaeraceae bacterium]
MTRIATYVTLTLVLVLALGLGHPIHAQPGTDPASRPATTSRPAALQPAPTPGEALERAAHAMALGDEAAYRQAAVIRSPSRFSEMQVRSIFASARLHKAVREHNVKGERTREAGFDRNQTLLVPKAPGAAEWEQDRDAIRKMEWKIDGDVARPATNASWLEGSSSGRISIERVEGGWVVILADPIDAAPAEHLQPFTDSAAAAARAADATTKQVEAGKLHTISEVNDFFDAERNKEPQKAS